MRIRRILVPTDLSPTSRAAVRSAGELARQFGAEVWLLFVAEPYAAPGDLYASPALVQLFEESRALARRRLATVEASLRRSRIRCRGLVAVGSPAPTIVETAATKRADLIVMATHGSTGLTHFFLGSVAERVVRTAGCPVLTIRPQTRTRRTRRSKAA
jgi:universal stress protein A